VVLTFRVDLGKRGLAGWLPTGTDADNLVSLDADPDVMRFVTGRIPTSREEIQNEVLPAFLGYYQRYEGYGFWAAIEKETGEFLGWFHFWLCPAPQRCRRGVW
jgi:RimJ/RimL family protein N-acetyltransferase